MLSVLWLTLLKKWYTLEANPIGGLMKADDTPLNGPTTATTVISVLLYCNTVD